MALWRLIQVNSAHTQEIRRLMCYFPDGPSNNITAFDTLPAVANAEALCSNLVSHPEISNAAPSGFAYFRDANSSWDVFSNGGFTNSIYLTSFEVGQRFYIDRWDNNHPYIEVVSKVGSNVGLQYKCYDGEVYANVTENFANYGSVYNMGCIPWCLDTNPDDWDSNADSTLFEYRLIYNVRGAVGFWTQLNKISTNYIVGMKFWGKVKPLDGDNPYLDGGTSETGGGDPQKQNFADASDVVSVDNMPDETTYGATACGLITIFKPSKGQLQHLADVMWGTNVISFLQNMVENISSMFISLAMVPFNVDAGATVSVQWLGLIDTAISLTLAGKQWYEFNMGTIMLDGSDDRAWATDSVLDYSPFSKLGIYLPFIGYQELDIDECRNHAITLTYRIDILSGTCIALIDVNGRTIYQFTGNCLTQLPLTSMDAQNLFTNAVNIGIAAASAGSTAAVASAGDAYTQERVAGGKLSELGGELQNQQHGAQVANAEGSLAGATANGMMGMKPSFRKTGAISASSSLFGVMQPYLFLTTPRQSVPERYQHFCGLPCNITGKLGNFSGLTVVEDVRLNGLVATSPEVEEIYQLLKSGIII